MQHFGMTKSQTEAKFHKPWWTIECKEQVALKIKLRRNYERRSTMENKLKYKRQCAITRRTIRRAKRTSFNTYVSQLSYNIPSSKVWRMIRNITGSNKTQLFQGPIFYNDQFYTENIDKANVLGKTLETIIGTENNVAWENAMFNCDKRYKLPDESGYGNYNAEISHAEFTDALTQYVQGKGTAMGDDLFHKQFLMHLSPNCKDFILMLFNNIWQAGVIPVEWKISIIFPLSKPGKDPTNPENFRPISFLSCLGKLLEKLFLIDFCGSLKKITFLILLNVVSVKITVA